MKNIHLRKPKRADQQKDLDIDVIPAIGKIFDFSFRKKMLYILAEMKNDLSLSRNMPRLSFNAMPDLLLLSFLNNSKFNLIKIVVNNIIDFNGENLLRISKKDFAV